MQKLNRDLACELYDVAGDMDFVTKAISALGDTYTEEELLDHLRKHAVGWAKKINALAEDAEHLERAVPREEFRLRAV